MTRIKAISQEDAKDEVKTIYENIHRKLGKIPNIFLNMGNSALALKSFTQLDENVSQTSIAPQIREKIALLVGQMNQCHYCLSAHSAIAKSIGVKEQDVTKARHGEAEDPKTEAILKFVRVVVENRGHVSNQVVASLKAAGVNEQELVEIILIITVNLYTNYFNLITDPTIDFPLAPKL